MKYGKQIKACKNMGELFDIAKAITDKDKAKEFFNDYVVYIMNTNEKMQRLEATQIAHSNLGYFAGYYSDEIRQHIQEMYGSAHPVFGTLKPTAEEAFEMGKKIGSKY